MKNFSLSYQTHLMYQIAYINLSNCIYHNLYRLIFKVIGTGYIISPEQLYIISNGSLQKKKTRIGELADPDLIINVANDIFIETFFPLVFY